MTERGFLTFYLNQLGGSDHYWSPRKQVSHELTHAQMTDNRRRSASLTSHLRQKHSRDAENSSIISFINVTLLDVAVWRWWTTWPRRGSSKTAPRWSKRNSLVSAGTLGEFFGNWIHEQFRTKLALIGLLSFSDWIWPQNSKSVLSQRDFLQIKIVFSKIFRKKIHWFQIYSHQKQYCTAASSWFVRLNNFGFASANQPLNVKFVNMLDLS